MNNTTINHDMTTEQYERMVQSIKALDAELGFSVNLTYAQRAKLQMMGDKTVAFVDKTMFYSTDRQDLVPSCSDLIEFKREYDLAKKLGNLLEIANPVIQKIRDSYAVVGAEAFSSARKIYGYIKAASVAGAPGSSAISKDLSKRFARTKTSDKNPEPKTTTSKAKVQKTEVSNPTDSITTDQE